MIGVEVILELWPYTGSIKMLHVECLNKETKCYSVYCAVEVSVHRADCERATQP